MSENIRIKASIDDQISGKLNTIKKTLQAAFGLQIANSAAELGQQIVKLASDFAKMVNQITSYQDKIAKSSKATGIAVESLAGLAFAADRSGVSLEGLSTGLKLLMKRASDAGSGMKSAKKTFEELGIEVKNTNGSLKSGDDLLLEVADAFKLETDATKKAAIAQELFGRSGMDLIPLLDEGKKGIEDLTGAAENLGIVFSKETAKNAEDFQDALTDLKAGLEGIKMSISAAVVPSMTALIRGLVPVQTELEKVTQKSLKEITTFNVLANTIERLHGKIDKTETEVQVLNDAYDEMNLTFGTYLPNLISEKDSYEDVSKAIITARGSLEKLIETRAIYAMQLDKINEMTKIRIKLKELEIKKSEIQARLDNTAPSAEWPDPQKMGGPMFEDIEKKVKSLNEELNKLKKELLKIGDLDPGKGGVIDVAKNLQYEIIATNALLEKQGIATRIVGESDKTYAKVVKLLTAAKKDLDGVNKNEVNALGNLTALGEANSVAIKEQISQLEKLKGAFEAVKKSGGNSGGPTKDELEKNKKLKFEYEEALKEFEAKKNGEKYKDLVAFYASELKALKDSGQEKTIAYEQMRSKLWAAEERYAEHKEKVEQWNRKKEELNFQERAETLLRYDGELNEKFLEEKAIFYDKRLKALTDAGLKETEEYLATVEAQKNVDNEIADLQIKKLADIRSYQEELMLLEADGSQQSYDLQVYFYKQKLALQKAGTQEYLDLLKKVKDAENASAENKKSIEQQKANDTKEAFLVMIENLRAWGEESQTAFELYKAYASAETMISAYKSAQKIFEAVSSQVWLGPLALPAAAAASGIAMAAGMAKASMIASQDYKGRAIGGDVAANQPYIVGERGREMFVPNMDGYIIPNNILKKMGGKSTVININAIDAQSFKSFLRNGGASVLESEMSKGRLF